MRKVYHIEQLPLFALSKVCTACEKDKPLDQYTQRKDGRGVARCKDCIRADDRDRNKIRRPRKTPIKPKPTQPDHKVCNTCFAEKPFAAFRQDQQKGDGYIGRCKQCEQERWDTLSEEDKEQYRLQDRMSREPRRELIHDRDRERYQKRRQEAPLVLRRSRSQYMARKKNATIEKVDLERILERDGRRCYICQQDILSHQEIDFDHIIPLSRGGSHCEANLAATHHVCNRRKSRKLPAELTDWDRRGPNA